MSQLVNNLILKGYLLTDRVVDAFSEIQRVEFLSDEFSQFSDAEISLPAGFGRTMIQPQVAATMIELLDVGQGQKVLEIASASGWITSILAYIVGKEGKIIGIEESSGLVELARENVDKYQFITRKQVEIQQCDIQKGYPKEAPYDRIMVNISFDHIPDVFLEQLQCNGVIVMPLYNGIWRISKDKDGNIKKESYAGFSFLSDEGR
ncbi:MAG: methyltransferase domain-containing protein [Candidatus Moraniibacteriota bacterium]|nr:MAG: methyltransferase domain-containing protein [Candidatus Moranbacteria bacterium]